VLERSHARRSWTFIQLQCLFERRSRTLWVGRRDWAMSSRTEARPVIAESTIIQPGGLRGSALAAEHKRGTAETDA
jgi:hypothetical protein